jgi:hypothetical protein
MNAGLYLGVAAACFAVGLACQHPRQVLAALAVWVLGLVIAAVAGTFEATAEDNSLGVFIFTGLPTVVWVAAFCLGMATGVIMRRRSAAKHH